jgi:hypothetical protein
MRIRTPLVTVSLAIVAGCGGSAAPPDPVDQVPQSSGVRERVRSATQAKATEFPPAEGRTLQELADGVASGPMFAPAGSVYTRGENRFAFGVIDQQGRPVYGPTAVYVASSPGAQAEGPYVAPADVLLTGGRFRSKQAATEEDPFAAIYAANVPFSKPGKWYVLVATKVGGRLIGASGEVEVSAPAAVKIPEVGGRAPAVHTDTLETAKGDVSRIDTRVPPSDMHEDFAKVLGRKPVALLFSTPQLCQSRVCGPVTDIALQMKAKYGERMTFVHQEVYVDNDINKGLREPLKQFGLQTEPWLFVIDRSGVVTARLEGSFGVRAFERAVKTGL